MKIKPIICRVSRASYYFKFTSQVRPAYLRVTYPTQRIRTFNVRRASHATRSTWTLPVRGTLRVRTHGALYLMCYVFLEWHDARNKSLWRVVPMTCCACDVLRSRRVINARNAPTSRGGKMRNPTRNARRLWWRHYWRGISARDPLHAEGTGEIQLEMLDGYGDVITDASSAHATHFTRWEQAKSNWKCSTALVTSLVTSSMTCRSGNPWRRNTTCPFRGCILLHLISAKTNQWWNIDHSD